MQKLSWKLWNGKCEEVWAIKFKRFLIYWEKNHIRYLKVHSKFQNFNAIVSKIEILNIKRSRGRKVINHSPVLAYVKIFLFVFKKVLNPFSPCLALVTSLKLVQGRPTCTLCTVWLYTLYKSTGPRDWIFFTDFLNFT